MTKHHGTSPLSRALDAAVKPVFQKRGFAERRIITDWQHIVGEVIARYSTPQKLVFPPEKKDQGVLHIDVYDSAFATEIHYLGPLILEKIATYFGYHAVARLQIMQRPLVVEPEVIAHNPIPVTEPEWLEASLDDIDDETLKAALKGLGKYMVGCKEEK